MSFRTRLWLALLLFAAVLCGCWDNSAAARPSNAEKLRKDYLCVVKDPGGDLGGVVKMEGNRLIGFKPRTPTTKDKSVRFAFLTKADDLKFDVVAEKDTVECMTDLRGRLALPEPECKLVANTSKSYTMECPNTKLVHSLEGTGGYNFVVGNIWDNGQMKCKWHIELKDKDARLVVKQKKRKN